jgi:phosphohistidine swiveling domain-containing protein
MIRYKNKKWELTVTRNMSLFQSCLDVAGHYLYSKNFGLPAYEHTFVVENGTRMYAHHNEENAEKYHKGIISICMRREKFDRLKAIYKKYENDLWRVSERLEKNSGKEEYLDYLRANLHLSAGLYLTTAIGIHILDLLQKKIKLLFPDLKEREVQMLTSEITYVKSFTPLSQSRTDLLDIGNQLIKNKLKPKDIEENPGLRKSFEKYYKKYYFIPVNFNGNPWTKNDIMRQLTALLKVNCQRKKESILSSHKEKNKTSKKRLKKINNIDISWLAEVLQAATMLNEQRKYIFCRASLAYRPLFRKIASENNLKDWRECWKLTPQEVYELHFKSNKKIVDLIQNRSWAGVTNRDCALGYSILKKSEMLPFIHEIKRIKGKDRKLVGNEIKGLIANKGRVIGRVRVVMGKKDFGKFKTGDILVTAMTSVDFIPLMERAGAFVTNEGGITSHASIVSRELNKPCIIGTKIATKVLIDGDLVEVDADHGIVKIIKKAK